MPHLHCTVCERALYSSSRFEDLCDPCCSECGSPLEVEHHAAADQADDRRFVRAGRLLGDPEPATR
jgi:predicted amidophosphoribosyltransferase